MKNKKSDSPAADSPARAPHEQGGNPANAAADAASATHPDGSRAGPPTAPRAGNHREQVKVWEEEGGSPPEQISSTNGTRPKTASKAGSMGSAKD
jgi:hypothetical protein